MIIRRPVLRYHGGKFKLAPWAIRHFPKHRIYVEPYGGAASVLMRKTRSYSEVYNDLDGEVVNLFKILRDTSSSIELMRLLKLTPYAREEFAESYEPAEEPIERARRMIVRSFMGFGSASSNADYKTGFRANSNRSGTTPAHDWESYADVIPYFTARLLAVTIENRDATKLIRTHDSEKTLFYVDPPYVRSTRHSAVTRGNNCYRFEMTDEEHTELSKVLHAVKGFVVLSGYDCDLYKALYQDWKSVSCQAYADGARDRTEFLWLSPRTAEALDLNLFN